MLPRKPEFVDIPRNVTAVLEDSFLPWTRHQHVDERSEGRPSREELLNDEITGLLSYLSLESYEKQARGILVSYMDSVVRSRWRGATATAFGSTTTGLSLPSGDIDLVVAFDDMGAHPTEKQIRRRLIEIESEFKRAGITSYATRILFARVPIISFTTSSPLGGLKVDVSISIGDDAGRKAIPLIKSYLEEMPALRALILCIKMFLSPRGLNNAAQGTLSSYAITLMTISFLQRNPTGLPVESISHPEDEKSLGTLLCDFFRYYSTDFPLATHYVSVSEMGIFPKEDKPWKIQSTPMLSVECIINPDKDITRGANKIRDVLDAFRRVSEVLQTAPIIGNESLLGKVIQVPRQMDASRNHLRTVMNNGAFQRATAGRQRTYPIYQAMPSLLERMGGRRGQELPYGSKYGEQGRAYGWSYQDHRTGYREIDQRSHYRDEDKLGVRRPKDDYGRSRHSYEKHERRSTDVKESVALPPKLNNLVSEASGLPKRPPSFEYMRSMEKRDNRGH